MGDSVGFFAKLAFALSQLLWLVTYGVAAFGAGQKLLGSLGILELDVWLRTSLRITAGIGIFIVSLFLLSAMGWLVPTTVLLLLTFGWLAALVHGWSVVKSSGEIRVFARLKRVTPKDWLWFVVIVLTAIPLLTRAVAIPFQFDELMYHLPTALDWAEQGGLVVNEWLRYPLSAFNFHLLYAASLVLGNDVFPHLIHGFAGTLITVGVFSVGRRYFEWRVGFLAALQTLYVTRWFYESAYVDLGVGLFLFFGFVAIALAYEQRDSRWVYVAAFFAGIAVGTKYQGLFYLPALVMLVLAFERRLSVVARAALILFIAGGYWYLRNLWISGDPLHPIGGHIFGYWLWNADDLKGQYLDFDRIRSFPEWYLCFAAASVLFLKGSSIIYRGLVAGGLVSVLIWIFISGYPRYLVPVYPLLALLSAYVFVRILDISGITHRFVSLYETMKKSWRSFLVISLVLVLGFNYVHDAKRFWGRIAPDAEARDTLLRKWSAAYEILADVDQPNELRLFQLGFEGEIYHFPTPVIGDWFGPGRYSEVIRRMGDGAELARYLAEINTNALLINRSTPPFADMVLDANIDRYLTLIARTDRAELYRLNDVN